MDKIIFMAEKKKRIVFTQLYICQAVTKSLIAALYCQYI